MMSSLTRFLSNASTTKTHFDVIVCGGGMIGTALTCLLAQSPILSDRKIALLEQVKPRQWSLSPNYSNRVSSVNEATKQLMEKIGAWDYVSKARYKPVKRMRVWDCSGGKIEFENNSSAPVAYIVENDILIHAAEEELKKARNVTVMNEAKVEQYNLPKLSGEQVELHLNNGSTISCDLLVGADGWNSHVRKAMGVQYLSWAYGQTAVVATLQLAKGSKNDTAWQRFLPTGPVALLPLDDELCSLVWSTSSTEAKNILNLSNESFVDALNDALNKTPLKSEAVNAVRSVAQRLLKLGDFSAQTSTTDPLLPGVFAVHDKSRAAFPLGFGHAASYVGPSVALVGDAAHKVHPLAGQGVNLGYGDVTCLVEQLTEAVQLGKPIGDLSALKEYERSRQAHNVPLMMAIDIMARVYSTTNPALLAAGHLALQIADSVRPIKDLMMRQAAV